MTSITVTSGPKNAHTDSATGLRYYTWRGRELPSSTSLRRMAGLPFMLHQWTISRVVERAVTEFATLERMLTRPAKPRERVWSKNVIKEASRWLRSAATEERDSAAELGTAVHDAATSGRALNQVELEVRPYLYNYLDWLKASGVKVLAVEKQCFNLSIGYAGTFDLLVEFPNGDIDVVDLKTGRGTYPDHAIQLVSYALAEFVGEDDVIDKANTKLLRQARGMALLHLTEDGWTYQRIKVTPELFSAFQGLTLFAVWAADHLTLEGLIEDETTGGGHLTP